MDQIPYQIFKTFLSIFKTNESVDNPPIRVYLNKIENWEYMLIKLKIELHLKLKGDIILKF